MAYLGLGVAGENLLRLEGLVVTEAVGVQHSHSALGVEHHPFGDRRMECSLQPKHQTQLVRKPSLRLFDVGQALRAPLMTVV